METNLNIEATTEKLKVNINRLNNVKMKYQKYHKRQRKHQLILLNETNDVGILLKIMILVLLKSTHITTYTHSCLSVYRDKFVMTHNNINNDCLWGVRLDKTINYVALLLCK